MLLSNIVITVFFIINIKHIFFTVQLLYPKYNTSIATPEENKSLPEAVVTLFTTGTKHCLKAVLFNLNLL